MCENDNQTEVNPEKEHPLGENDALPFLSARGSESEQLTAMPEYRDVRDFVQLVTAGELDDHPQIHHRHTIRDMANHLDRSWAINK